MHPMNNYETLRRGREELSRQAEYQRMLRAAIRKQRRQTKFYSDFTNWLGTHLVGWMRRPEQLGVSEQAKRPVSVHREPSTT